MNTIGNFGVREGALIKLRFAAILLAAIVGSSAAVIAQEKAFAPRLSGVLDATGRDAAEGIFDRPLFATPVPLGLSGADACGDQALFPSLQDYTALVDRSFQRADRIAVRVNACSSSCQISLNAAELCGFVDQTETEITWLETASDVFLTGQLVFEEADARAVGALRALSDSSNLIATEALGQIEAAATAVAQNDVSRMNMIGIGLSAEEIHAFGLLLLALDDFGVVLGSGPILGEELQLAGSKMARLGDDIHVALTRAAVMQPATASQLQREALEIAAVIAWASHSLDVAANIADQTAATEVNTNATAMPSSGDGSAALAACFAEASLASALAQEAAVITKDLLSECPAVQACAAEGNSTPGFGGFLMRFDQSEKQVFTVANAICKAE